MPCRALSIRVCHVLHRSIIIQPISKSPSSCFPNVIFCASVNTLPMKKKRPSRSAMLCPKSPLNKKKPSLPKNQKSTREEEEEEEATQSISNQPTPQPSTAPPHTAQPTSDHTGCRTHRSCTARSSSSHPRPVHLPEQAGTQTNHS